MKAAVCERYGPPEVVQIRDVPTPVPADGEVLVKASATTVNSGDARVRALRVPRGMTLPVRLKLGVNKPKNPVLGFDVAGEVAAVGSAVTSFQPGDRVVASRGFDLGCHAEYVAVAEEGAIATIPESVGHQDAVALCFGGMTALHFFGLGKLAAGETVLVNGASGAVGTMAVQLAKHLGAEVTAVCSGRNVEQARSLGADHVIDYNAQDFTRSGRRYDVLLDVAGGKSWSQYRRVLNPHATLVLVGGKGTRLLGPLGHIARVRLAAWRGSQRAVFFIAKLNEPDLAALRELLESGSVKPVVEKRYELGEVADALRHIGEGHAQGKLVISV